MAATTNIYSLASAIALVVYTEPLSCSGQASSAATALSVRPSCSRDPGTWANSPRRPQLCVAFKLCRGVKPCGQRGFALLRCGSFRDACNLSLSYERDRRNGLQEKARESMSGSPLAQAHMCEQTDVSLAWSKKPRETWGMTSLPVLSLTDQRFLHHLKDSRALLGVNLPRSILQFAPHCLPQRPVKIT